MQKAQIFSKAKHALVITIIKKMVDAGASTAVGSSNGVVYV